MCWQKRSEVWNVCVLDIVHVDLPVTGNLGIGVQLATINCLRLAMPPPEEPKHKYHCIAYVTGRA